MQPARTANRVRAGRCLQSARNRQYRCLQQGTTGYLKSGSLF
nr:MAG TPA: hypothetical protein [Caudoviricetes sp.]